MNQTGEIPDGAVASVDIRSSVFNSRVLECCKYGGRKTVLSLASRGGWTRDSQLLDVTNEKSRFWDTRCSEAETFKSHALSWRCLHVFVVHHKLVVEDLDGALQSTLSLGATIGEDTSDTN